MKMIDYIIQYIMPTGYRIKHLRNKGLRIGNGCEIYRSVNFGSEPYLISIGNDVRITSGVKFCTHDGGIWTLRKKRTFARCRYLWPDNDWRPCSYWVE